MMQGGAVPALDTGKMCLGLGSEAAPGTMTYAAGQPIMSGAVFASELQWIAAKKERFERNEPS